MSNQPEREIIVTSEGGSGVGMVLAAVILVLGIIAAIWYFNSSGSADSLPDEINVNIDTGSDPGTETTIAP
ncbi:MAG TPA: hypothetical protein VLA54_06885 [Acidimicrobiia bacterium]|nr:hypothetical protein [Acidimicrobiia bacterium]